MADMSFWIPIPPDPKGKRISAEEAEKLLLEKLKKCEKELENAICELAIFYSKTNRHNLAMESIQRLVANSDDPEKKALYFLKMGEFMEQIANYEAAIQFYSLAFSLEPVYNDTWYFINNNLGYCLNYLGRYKEAEPYCRAAIQIEPRRHNAYKNLGISLEGQGQYTDAAKLYIKAVQTNAGDPRALSHLEELVAKHGEIIGDIPDIHDQIKMCQEAVYLALKIQQELEDRFKKKMQE